MSVASLKLESVRSRLTSKLVSSPSSADYAPQIFAQIGLTGTSVGLLASGIYGIVKIVATSIFIFVGIERIGRKKALGFGGLGMSLFLWIIGAIFATHPPAKIIKGQAPPPPNSASVSVVYSPSPSFPFAQPADTASGTLNHELDGHGRHDLLLRYPLLLLLGSCSMGLLLGE